MNDDIIHWIVAPIDAVDVVVGDVDALCKPLECDGCCVSIMKLVIKLVVRESN